MKALGYIGAFLGGAIVGVALGLVFAPETGKDTRTTTTDAADGSCKKHDIKPSRNDQDDFIDHIQDATPEEV